MRDNENLNVPREFETIDEINSEESGTININICSLNVHGLAKFEGDREFQQHFKK